MQWKGRRASSNVEDRRGKGGGLAIGGGIGGIILVLLVTLLGGGNGGDILNSLTGLGTQSSAPYQETAEEKDLSQFVSVVLADTEDVWTDIFKQKGMTYEKPTLVLYTDRVQSACGTTGSSVGPFYCPGDHKLYIDLSFYDELRQKFQAPGDFAMAYVIAHEVGHHVQTLLGDINKKAAGGQTANQLSVRTELQADYYAGVWAHHAQDMNVLDPGDLEEALTAASAVGDDTIQKKAQGYAVPESFTHGTAEQRMRWFKKGFDTGTIEGGDTFHASSL
ncbi:KPN_02809 family neutral zinc metallopeptidase [Paenibacillus chibensis]|uniref:KPN_02809 family neutral zinc metallopeptidase n=1 Tax=Paenibacillus chibensis TaxID=59846 RepID=UPI000FD859A1|nr:neutral zinc metallopeptidase [Paenibacillus chibensis]MEC0371031.1 zinc metallopeptidase [Paenibacillus chibensis]